MTVAATSPITSYVGNGGSSTFSFTFPVFTSSQLLVTFIQASTGSTTTGVLGTDYSVSGLNAAGTPASTGNIALINSSQAWLTAGLLSTGWSVVIQSLFPYSQATSIRNQGSYLPAVLEDALDNIVYELQQMYLVIGSQLTLPTGLLPSAFSPTLPNGMPSSAGLALVVNSTGTGIALGAGSSVSLPVTIAQGGTASTSALSNGKIMASSGGKIVESVVKTPTNWAAYTPTLSAGWGTATNKSFFWRQIGDTLEVRGSFNCGTVAGSVGKISLPNSLNIDTTKIPTGLLALIGPLFCLPVTSPQTSYPSYAASIFADGSNNDGVFMTYQSDTRVFKANNVSALCSNGDGVALYFSVPVV